MNQSLAISLTFSIAAAAAAALACLAGGGGWLAALALYSAVGSISLVTLALIAARDPVVAAKPVRRAAGSYA